MPELSAPLARWQRLLATSQATTVSASLTRWVDVLGLDAGRLPTDSKPTVWVDFDGTLCKTGAYTPGVPTAPPIAGARDALRALAQRFRVVVLTARPVSEVVPWLHRHQVADLVADVTNTKPPGSVAGIDDGVIAFTSWPDALAQLDTRLNRIGVDAAAYAYGCVLLRLPPSVANPIRAFAATIPDALLRDKGREDEVHVTVLYGVTLAQTATLAELQKITAQYGPIPIRFGKSSVFTYRGKAGSVPYDVVKVDVISQALLQLAMDCRAALPHVDLHSPVFTPHVTIGYVEAGKGAQFAGWTGVDGLLVTADELVYSDPTGGQTVLRLGVPAQ